MHPKFQHRRVRASPRWLLALLLATVTLTSLVGASHTSPDELAANSVSASGWSDPANVRTNDAKFAATTTDGSMLSVDAFAEAGHAGTITKVQVLIDQSQPSRTDDRLLLEASAAGGGCGSVSASPTSHTTTSGRTTVSSEISCGAGWTWQRLAGLSVTLTAEARGGLLGIDAVDGQWRVYYVRLMVAYTNQPPTASVADAGPADEGQTVLLDGSESLDPEGGPLSYQWSQTAGPSVAISGATTATPSFVAPQSPTNAGTNVEFALTVTDDVGHTATGSVQVHIANVNQAPVGSAGIDQVVDLGSPVQLDATGSVDADGDPLTYDWAQTAGPAVALDDDTAARPTFTAPFSEVSLTFQVIASDGYGGVSDADAVTVLVQVDATDAPGGSQPQSQLRIVPDAVELAANETQQLVVELVLPDGQTFRPSGGCVWDTQESGGSLDGAPEACVRNFTAGSTFGQNLVVSASLDTGAGTEVTAVASITLVVRAEPVTPGLPDGVSARCEASIPAAGTSGPFPIRFPQDCGVAMAAAEVTLEAPASQTVQFVVDALDSTPQGTTAPAGLRGTFGIYEHRLEGPDGTPVPLAQARLEYALEDGWLAGVCPDTECSMIVYRHSGDGWVELDTEFVPTAAGARVVATTQDFSPFLVAAAPTAALAGPPADAFPWLALLFGALLMALLLAVGTVGYRRMRPASTEAPGRQPSAGLVEELRNEELIQFLNNASHDLASPLTPIKVQLAILERVESEQLTDRQKQALKVVARNVEHMGMLVGDLKEASRIQAGKFQLFPEPCDVASVVRDAVEAFRDPAKEAQIQLDLKEGAAALPANADRGRLTQVLYNLINNALKFTPKDGRIRVQTSIDDGMAKILVRDTGLGLTADDAALLFKPFAQVHSDEQKKKGSGLGLYICKGIVEEHGGRIWCQSPGPGKGTTFGFTIPLAPPGQPGYSGARLHPPRVD